MKRFAVGLVILVIAVASGILAAFGLERVRDLGASSRDAVGAQPNGSSSQVEGSGNVTDGVAPALKLPAGAQFVRGALSGHTLGILANVPSAGRALTLFEIDTTTFVVRQVPLGVDEIGEWAGLTADMAGNFWAGVDDKIVEVPANGLASAPITVPHASHRLPIGYGAPAGPPGTGMAENGEITSLAVTPQGDVVAGRLGYTELTIFEPTTGQFSTLALPQGVGDVAQLASAPSGATAFTVNHSAAKAGVLHDVVGLLLPDRSVRVLPIAAASIATSSAHILIGGRALAILDGTGAAVGQSAASSAGFDPAQVALRRDDVTVIRASGGHQATLLDGRGQRVGDVIYQVPITQFSNGAAQPYNAPWVFAVVDATNATWFGLKGYNGVYRIPS